MTKPSIIAICSPKPQCGKSTIAQFVCTHGYSMFSFAEPIRKMVIAFLMEYGVSYNRAVLYVKSNKADVIPEVGTTARKLMQTIGTEWGRNIIHKDIWVSRLGIHIQKLVDSNQPVRICIDDMRFINEFSAVKKFDNQIWYVDRNIKADPDVVFHGSEQDHKYFVFDKTFYNDNFYTFKSEVMKHCESLFGAA